MVKMLVRECLSRGGSSPVCDFDLKVTLMKNESCSVPQTTDQDRLLPDHEYEELHGL